MLLLASKTNCRNTPCSGSAHTRTPPGCSLPPYSPSSAQSPSRYTATPSRPGGTAHSGTPSPRCCTSKSPAGRTAYTCPALPRPLPRPSPRYPVRRSPSPSPTEHTSFPSGEWVPLDTRCSPYTRLLGFAASMHPLL